MQRTLASRAASFRRPLLRPINTYVRRAFYSNSSTSSYTRPSIFAKPYRPIAASIALTSATFAYMYASPSSHTTEMESGVLSPPISAYSTPSPSTTVAELLDENSRNSLHSKSTSELLLALFVYKLCTYPWLVDVAPHLIKLAETMHVEQLAYWFVKNTFFAYFCGGETAEECVSTMDKLARSGINCILDLSVEADLHEGNNQKKDSFELAERQADHTLEMIKYCLQTAAQGQQFLSNGAFAAVKVTAFAPPEFLLRLNQALSRLDKAFYENQVNGKLDRSGLEKIADQVLPPPACEQQRQARQQLLANAPPAMDYIEFSKLFNLSGPKRDIWWRTDKQDGLLTSHELAAYDRMVNRLDQVCKLASELHTGVMIDAEQSYFQEAVDHVALNMEAKYNQRNGEQPPTVYNTYQMYTKGAQRKLEIDVERAKRENFTFAAKLVRGAYMVSERQRALEYGYPSPIHDTIEDTHASFNGGVRFLLSKLREHQEETGEPLTGATAPIVFMVATHNRESVILTVQEMERNHVLPRSGVVHFGQLFGMQDQISYALGKNGYSIYKYLPYGMVNEVIPYLIRRAQENSSVLGGASKERELIVQEVKDRLLGRAGKTVIHQHQPPPPLIEDSPSSPSTETPSSPSPLSSSAENEPATDTSISGVTETA